MGEERGVLLVEEDPLGNSLGPERFSLSPLGLQIPWFSRGRFFDFWEDWKAVSSSNVTQLPGFVEHIFEIRLWSCQWIRYVVSVKGERENKNIKWGGKFKLLEVFSSEGKKHPDFQVNWVKVKEAECRVVVTRRWGSRKRGVAVQWVQSFDRARWKSSRNL